MKGTMKRGRTGDEDRSYLQMLRNDEKNRSENVMIVDLLRNDLSRLVAATGGGFVNVASLFDVERYQSVFQMTSSIVADRLKENSVSPEEMLQALFPCGSVTGAPKIRTMEIINELEEQPRGVYTGAIGYFSPAGKAVFNVPIRTVVLNGNQGEMGIGSGIVADSSPDDEWQECLLKANFLTSPLPEFELIETMLHSDQDGYLYLEDHLQRLQSSASYFNYPFDREQTQQNLEQFAGTFEQSRCRRVRLTLSLEGKIELTSAGCEPPAHLILPGSHEQTLSQPVLIGFAEQRTDSSLSWLFHKTTRRALYNEAYGRAQADGLFDVIFCNERQEITEGCITNILILKNNIYYTPPLDCGLLNGVMRKQLLASAGKIPVVEQVLYRADILEAEKIFLCNSVRGVIRARIQSDS
jgi:para-aminobenzoate synthetase/4-amino-4-deoxychorismate lyase